VRRNLRGCGLASQSNKNFVSRRMASTSARSGDKKDIRSSQAAASLGGGQVNDNGKVKEMGRARQGALSEP
jgi:hypothetical protein